MHLVRIPLGCSVALVAPWSLRGLSLDVQAAWSPPPVLHQCGSQTSRPAGDETWAWGQCGDGIREHAVTAVGIQLAATAAKQGRGAAAAVEIRAFDANMLSRTRELSLQAQ